MESRSAIEGSQQVSTSGLSTEARHPDTDDLDIMSTSQLLSVMNREDQTVPLAVHRALPTIARAVDLLVEVRGRGGRLIYIGAGTSGRIGLLDAVECPPTFGTDPDEVIGLLAGGDGAFATAAEGAEDQSERGQADLESVSLSTADAVIGLTASGRTPYVVGALRHARRIGAVAISIACNAGSEVSTDVDVAIELDTGPEVLTGSTRLKAGTAQKLVCNMLSTAVMVRTGKAYTNLMVDVLPTNAKLRDRAVRIVAAAAQVDEESAARAVLAAGGHAKPAIVMLLSGQGIEQALASLDLHDGRIRDAIATTGMPRPRQE